jgi:hypothetical protein
MGNLAAKVATDLWPEFTARVSACYRAPSRAIVRHARRLRRSASERREAKLMFGALAADRWRGLRFTEFELRQIATVRKRPRRRSPRSRVSSKSAP